ncbi:hypothetical protein D9756_000965 [Leucocoprinus leucothites]|uniref:MARVEL domain-containing protein n=1 Tax=Leucocoprinus leucothites TaxID=201217 RepID=A0A8H5GG16_9AGAR|nr:hypothetical protein D9756_000965 [Leucoagaricus leucothites]
MSNLLPLIRIGVFGTVSLFSFIVLVMSAHILSMARITIDFAALGVAVAVLTLLTLPVMLFLGRIRSGALPSFIAVELGWTGFLWVMWLASAGTTASINGSGGRCVDFGGASTLCGEVNAIEAFAFLNWLMLMGYFVVLLVFSFRAVQAGNNHIWTTSVNDANFEGGHNHAVHQPAHTSQYPPMSVAHA